MAFALFMASALGRALRIIAGLALIVVGIVLIKDVAGWIVAVVGLVPLSAGLFDFCLFAPLFGAPFSGDAVRQGYARSR